MRIDMLLQLRTSKPVDGKAVPMAEDELFLLIEKVRCTFAEQPMLLELDAPMKVVGDVHGQYYDLRGAELVKRQAVSRGLAR
ncbi:unnamed protein product [Effrenium voratum]|nr:unnamed protein product [Effrenium voratum]